MPKDASVWHAIPGCVPVEAGYIPVRATSARQLSAFTDAQGNVHINSVSAGRTLVRMIDTREKVVVSSSIADGSPYGPPTRNIRKNSALTARS
jgi:hypothetical protein